MDVTPVEMAESLGQRDGFAAFYERAYPGAKRLAHLLLNGSPDAEDVVQESLTRIHRRYSAVEFPDRYLRAAVVNGTKQRFRSHSRERARLRVAPCRRSL